MTGTSGGGGSGPAPVATSLAVLRDLFDELERRDIACCHWKSNSHLEAAMAGETDLDLLVDPSSQQQFASVMARLGFLLTQAAPGKHYDGLENYVGYDPAANRLVHLHVHYRLVLGQQHVKDFVLPIERELLAERRRLHGVPVPDPAHELIILSMRAVLKYRLRDAAKDLLARRGPGIPRAIAAEAQWLLEQTSLSAVDTKLAAIADRVPAQAVRRIIPLLVDRPGRALELAVAREQVRHGLRPHRRLSRPSATVRYLHELRRRRLRKLGLARRRRMTVNGPGVMVAIVGSDGAGKSTLIDELRRRLGWRLDVLVVYMGTSAKSRPVVALSRLARLGRGAHRRALSKHGPSAHRTRAAAGFGAVTLATRRLAEAWVIARRHNAAQGHAARGGLVFFDRYPLPGAPIAGRTMDGPRIAAEIPPPRPGLIDRFERHEQALFDRLPPPDHTIVLTVPLEQAIRRKPDHDPQALRAKAEALATMVEQGPESVVIDTSDDLDTVAARVTALVWSWLA